MKGSESRSSNPPVELLDRRQIDSPFNCLSTPLKNSFLHFIMLGLLASAASLLIWQIALPLELRVYLLMVVLLKIGQDFFHALSKRNLADFTQLTVIEHKWFGLLKSRQQQALQLLGVSSFLGLGFVLKFKIKKTNKIYHLILWNINTDPEFLRYCKQIINFGVPNE